MDRETMTKRRFGGLAVEAAKSVLTQPAEALAMLHPDIFRGLPLGVIILHLENPQDVKTFRIIDLNPAAALMTGATLEDLRGRKLAEFPKLLKTPFPVRCLDALRAGESRNLGEISYGDERIREGIYSVNVFPLPGDFMGVTFENIAERKRAEQARRESDER
jgi:PAS domain-containing protein